MDRSASIPNHFPVATADAKVLFGNRVRELRRRRGWSQEGFAQRIGLDRSYMGGVERGERNVSIENIPLIANGHGGDDREVLLRRGKVHQPSSGAD